VVVGAVLATWFFHADYFGEDFDVTYYLIWKNVSHTLRFYFARTLSLFFFELQKHATSSAFAQLNEVFRVFSSAEHTADELFP
jgi:hypothetical protein